MLRETLEASEQQNCELKEQMERLERKQQGRGLEKDGGDFSVPTDMASHFNLLYMPLLYKGFFLLQKKQVTMLNVVLVLRHVWTGASSLKG